MGARVVAALLAAAMVVGAVFVRRAIDDDDNKEAPRRDSAAGSHRVCATELDDVCIGLDLVEAAGATADRLIAAENAAGADVRTWVTVGPWPQMVDEARVSNGKRAVFASRGRTLASTELVAVVARKPASCTGDVTWRCLGDAIVAGARVAAPARGSGARLLATAAFAGGKLGRSNYASNDISDDPEAADWLTAVDQGIERSRGFGATSLADFLVKQGSADVFVTTRADAITSAAPESMLTTPTPLVRAAAAFGAAGEVEIGDLIDRLQLFNGQAPPQPAAGLPSPGVLLALREVGG